MRHLAIRCLILAVILGLAAMFDVSRAHPVVVDGVVSDWILAPPTNQDTAHYGRDLQQAGEFLWSDRQGDERTNFSNPDPGVDLRTFGVTADGTGLYFLMVMQGAGVASGDGSVMVQIAIDLDRVAGSGQRYFTGLADTTVPNTAAWEYLVRTSFGSGGNAILLDQAFTQTAILATGHAGTVIEISVPWADLGLPAGPTQPLRLSVATFRSTPDDNTWDIPGWSNALDVVTDYGDPGFVTNTFEEIIDGVLNDYVDVWFHVNPDREPLGPVLISEVAYWTSLGTEEWVELVNISRVTLDLTGWRVGDEEVTNGTEGMVRFPSGASIAAAGAVVVANTGTAFLARYGFRPDFEINESDPAVPNMIAEPLWATGALVLANSGDEILLLDPTFSIVDVVTYGIGNYPGVTPHPGAAVNVSLERGPIVRRDRNDCSVDFRSQANPNPRSVSDVDDDGFSAPNDCDDADAAIHPGATEACNGLDDDCSSGTPDGLDEAWYHAPCDGADSDLCEEGQYECAAGAQSCSDTTDDTVETCDDVDNDCDGSTDEGLPLHTYYVDADSDGYGDGGNIVESCHEVPPPGSVSRGDDCNDADPAVHPGVEDTCNAVDDDCDNQTDEDYVPIKTNCGIGACASFGFLECVAGVEQDSCTPGPPISSTDTTCDGVDDDCDGRNDENYLPVPTHCGVGACYRTGSTGCLDGGVVDTCLPGAPTEETCNGIDDDCDDVTDNATPPAGIPELTLSKPGSGSVTAVLSWGGVAGATGYDVVRGSLAGLRDSEGDYSFAVDACLRNNLPETTAEDAEAPDRTQPFWYLTRAANCGGGGTYDGTSPRQSASRDPGIAAAGEACP